MKTGKLTFYISRSFSIGFTIHSYKLNGICFEVNIFCFGFRYWGKGKQLIFFNNYWRKQS